jgi:hypothetical protein
MLTFSARQAEQLGDTAFGAVFLQQKKKAIFF